MHMETHAIEQNSTTILSFNQNSNQYLNQISNQNQISNLMQTMNKIDASTIMHAETVTSKLRNASKLGTKAKTDQIFPQTTIGTNQRQHNQDKELILKNNLPFFTPRKILIILGISIVIASILAVSIYFIYQKVTKQDGSYPYLQLKSSKYPDSFYDLFLLNSTQAVCLDGSPGSYYASSDGNPKNILLVFNGGGWCNGLENCYHRSFGQFGSSKDYNISINLDLWGIYSNHQDNFFKDWKIILINYCGGTGHQGYKKDPSQFNGTNVYFRGHNITTEILQKLETQFGLFSSAQKVVIGGLSAGAVAALMWSNYITQRVKTAKVWTFSDSGLFLDAINVQTGVTSFKQDIYKEMMKISNVQVDLPVPQCIAQFPTSKQNCMFSQNIIKHIKSPLFFIHSSYDNWAIQFILNIHCLQLTSMKNCSSSERYIIEKYRNQSLKILDQVVKDPKNGVWAQSCINHVYITSTRLWSGNDRIPQGSQNSISNTIGKWIEGGALTDNKHTDLSPWPSNTPCSGLD